MIEAKAKGLLGNIESPAKSGSHGVLFIVNFISKTDSGWFDESL